MCEKRNFCLISPHINAESISTTYALVKLQERLEAASKGLQVHVVGLSIHHAEVEIREKLAIPEYETERSICGGAGMFDRYIR